MSMVRWHLKRDAATVDGRALATELGPPGRVVFTQKGVMVHLSQMVDRHDPGDLAYGITDTAKEA